MNNTSIRDMTSGRYRVQEVYCNICQERLGWYYEHAFDRSQKNKEKKIVLEVAHIRSGDEIPMHGNVYNGKLTYVMTSEGTLRLS